MQTKAQRPQVIWAIAVAFLAPGIFATTLMPLLAPTEWNPGQIQVGLTGFALAAISTSALGAVLASPVVVLSLLVWKLLYRLRLIRYWAFTLIGFIAGATVGLYFASFIEFESWGYVRSFSAAGALTGLFVWLIAYGWSGGTKKVPRVTSDA